MVIKGIAEDIGIWEEYLQGAVMRIIVNLDKALLKRAMLVTGVRSKREVVDIALRALAGDDSKPSMNLCGPLDCTEVLNMFGKDMIDPDYDPKNPSPDFSKRCGD